LKEFVSSFYLHCTKWRSGQSPSELREALGVSVNLSEQEVHWHGFMSNLTNRGLYRVNIFISDTYGRPKAARKAIFPTIPW